MLAKQIAFVARYGGQARSEILSWTVRNFHRMRLGLLYWVREENRTDTTDTGA